MCGIVGYIGKGSADDILLDGLKRLEYRGYDSAGLAIHTGKKIQSIKAVGKVAALEKKMLTRATQGHCGIAHTRWATHGSPSVKNAHPHTAGKITLVHNGIIENYAPLKKMLRNAGHHFVSDTDSEVLAHLIEEENKTEDFASAVLLALKHIRGTYALAVMHADEPEKLIVVRQSSPLVIGVARDAFIVASDASAIVAHTDRVIYLDDGEMAILTPEHSSVQSLNKKIRHKKEHRLEWSDAQAKKEGFDHFMIKEIHEQPHAIEDAMRGRIDLSNGLACLGGLTSVQARLRRIKRIVFVSCGTSYYAALVGEYMLEEYAGIPTEVEFASEFRYRKPLIDKYTAVIALSQSGETADTLAAVREAKNKGALTLGIVNAVGSTIARETDAGIYNHAGPEIGVASTKAFTSQLTILVLLTVLLGRQRAMSMTMGRRILSQLRALPRHVDTILLQEKKIKRIARTYAKYEHFFYLGRKYNYPIASEGALKIKEVAYTHAEGYPAGEMKHGPIALLDKDFPTVILAPRDSVYEKTLSAIEEIRARKGRVLAITTKGCTEVERHANHTIMIPKTLEMLTPILSVVPLQILAYYVGIARGHDVDQPRNLAKSVTVE